VQVGTSPIPFSSKGADYAFISSTIPKRCPRIAPVIDLPLGTHVRERQQLEPLPEGISRYGAIPPKRQRASHGITRHHLHFEDDGLGFAVMSGFARKITPAWGKLFTRQGISLNLLQPITLLIGGPDVSAGLPTSPQGSDHLIVSSVSQPRWSAYGL
jgi:hypothetical protein